MFDDPVLNRHRHQWRSPSTHGLLVWLSTYAVHVHQCFESLMIKVCRQLATAILLAHFMRMDCLGANTDDPRSPPLSLNVGAPELATATTQVHWQWIIQATFTKVQL